MKYVIVLADGMADEPLEQLGGKTPMEVAVTPAMDELAKYGRVGLVSTVPQNMMIGSAISGHALEKGTYKRGHRPHNGGFVKDDYEEDGFDEL